MELQSKTKITIRWVASTYTGGVPIEKYGIYVRLEGASYLLVHTHSDLTNLVYTHSILSQDIGKTFSFQVSALNEVGESLRSTAISVIAGTYPNAPQVLNKVSADINQITFSWSNPPDDGGTPIIDYKIYWDNGTGEGLFILANSVGVVN